MGFCRHTTTHTCRHAVLAGPEPIRLVRASLHTLASPRRLSCARSWTCHWNNTPNRSSAHAAASLSSPRRLVGPGLAAGSGVVPRGGSGGTIGTTGIDRPWGRPPVAASTAAAASTVAPVSPAGLPPLAAAEAAAAGPAPLPPAAVTPGPSQLIALGAGPDVAPATSRRRALRLEVGASLGSPRLSSSVRTKRQ